MSAYRFPPSTSTAGDPPAGGSSTSGSIPHPYALTQQQQQTAPRRLTTVTSPPVRSVPLPSSSDYPSRTLSHSATQGSGDSTLGGHRMERRIGEEDNLSGGLGSDNGRRKLGASGRRIIDGREETREERRIRKGSLDGPEGTEGSYLRGHRSRTSRTLAPPSPSLSTSSLASPPIASTSSASYFVAQSSSSAGSSTVTPSAISGVSSTSKSVLTIALQRAQSAVLLDSANNVPAAIAAYTQSVRLLKEVILRAEETLRRERERERGRVERMDGEETDEERWRRAARFEKKEKAKLDEGRRLKVIHDTYEDRIRMLFSMGATPPNFDDSHPSPTPPASSSPVTARSQNDTPPVPRNSLPRHRAERSLESLSSASPPSSVHTSSPLHKSVSPLVTRQVLEDSPPISAIDPRAVEAIGSAMLNGSPPTSPFDPDFPRTPPQIRSSLRSKEIGLSDGESTPREFSGRRRTKSGEDDEPSDRLTPTAMRRTASDQVPDTLLRMSSQPMSKTNYSSEGTETDSTFAYSSINASSRDTSGTFSTASGGVARTPSISIEPGSPLDPFLYYDSPPPPPDSELPPLPPSSTYTTPNTSPLKFFSQSSIVDDDQEESAPPSFGFESNIERFSQIPSDSTISSRRDPSEYSDSSYSSLLRPTSDDSASSRATSHLPALTSPLFTNGLPSPRLKSYSVSGPDSPQSYQPRQARSASLANNSPGDRSGFGRTTPIAQTAIFPSRVNKKPLVSSSTDMGTISQRRKSSNPPTFSVTGEVEEELLDDVRDLPTETVGSRRAASTEPSDFGPSPSSHATQYNSASLPSRLRSLSQPNKRPQIPNHDSAPSLPSRSNTFRSVSGPSFGRKMSAPFAPLTLVIPPTLGTLRRTNSNSSRTSVSESRGGIPFPVGSETPTSATFSHRPSLGGSVSYLNSPPPLPLNDPNSSLPIIPIRRPFNLMKSILTSTESGSYVTPRLYVPKELWTQHGVKLVALETKVRMLDLLLTGLEAVEKAGEGMLGTHRDDDRGVYSNGGKFEKELEAFEGLVEGIQSTMAKKLGYATSGKKMGATSFSAWSSKLSRSLDRVTNGRSLDSPATYVDSIARVCKQAQYIDHHILSLAANEGAYAGLSPSDCQKIEQRLRRTSDFFGQVICRFILKDLGMLLEKYVKRGSSYLMFEA